MFVFGANPQSFHVLSELRGKHVTQLLNGDYTLLSAEPIIINLTDAHGH